MCSTQLLVSFTCGYRTHKLKKKGFFLFIESFFHRGFWIYSISLFQISDFSKKPSATHAFLDFLLTLAEKKDTSFLKTTDTNMYLTVRQMKQFLLWAVCSAGCYCCCRKHGWMGHVSALDTLQFTVRHMNINGCTFGVFLIHQDLMCTGPVLFSREGQL